MKIEMKRPYLFKCHWKKCVDFGRIIEYSKTLSEYDKFKPICKKCKTPLIREYRVASVTSDGFKGVVNGGK